MLTALRSTGTVECASDIRSWQRHGGVIWLDVGQPKRPELEPLAATFGVPAAAVNIALAPRSRPKLVTFDRCFLLTLYAPKDLPLVRRRLAPLDRTQELDIIAGDGFLITVHDEFMPSLETVWTQHERSTAAPRDASALIHELMDEAVDLFFPLLDTMVERVESVQEMAFVGLAGNSGEARSAGATDGTDGAPKDRTQMNVTQVRELFNVRRQLTNLRRILEPQRAAVAIMAREELPYFRGDEAAFQDIFDHTVRQADVIGVYAEMLISAREAYLVRLSNLLAVAAKTLLTLTLFLAVPMFVFSVYGMNFERMPELGWPIGHALPFITILVADTLLYLYFRHRLRIWQ